jgi:glycosyltransferase involved in cell wall biosynthesis
VQRLVYPLEALASRLSTLSYDIGTPLPFGYQVDGSLTLAVDPATMQNTDRRSGHPTVLFVGTWYGRKRGEFLAERFTREVQPRHPTAELLMVSDTCVERPGVKWIRYPSDDELRGLYRRAWVLCSPSTYEGFGLPYLEAMQHGLPVVATPNPGARHVLGPGAGRLATDAELGAAIADLLADDDERARLASSGRRRAEMFTWERVVDQHERAYELAITKYRRRRASGYVSSGDDPGSIAAD